MKRIKMKARFDGKCNYCLKKVIQGTEVFYDPDHKAVFHPQCKDQPWVEVVGKQMWNSASRPLGGGVILTGMRN